MASGDSLDITLRNPRVNSDFDISLTSRRRIHIISAIVTTNSDKENEIEEKENKNDFQN